MHTGGGSPPSGEKEKAKSRCKQKAKEEGQYQLGIGSTLAMQRTPEPPQVRLQAFRKKSQALPD